MKNKNYHLPELPDGISYMSESDFNAMLATGGEGRYAPVGLFVIEPTDDASDNSWTCVDNSNGNAWTEGFSTLEEGIDWLLTNPVAEFGSLDDNEDEDSSEEPVGIPNSILESVVVKYINADAAEVEGSYALGKAREFGLSDDDIRKLGLSWLLDLNQDA